MKVADKKWKYRQIEEMLRSRMQSGELGVGDRLPSFAQMHRDHGATETTMRRVYELLEKDNLIERRGGSGVYVAERSNQPHTGKIGLLFHTLSLTGPYISEVLHGVRSEAARHDLELLLLNEDTQRIERGKIDAVLLYCHVTEALAIHLPVGLPHVLMGQHSPDFTCVAADDFEGAKMAVRHLLDLGHRRIAYLLRSDHDTVSCRRLEGYYAAHREAGINVKNGYVRFLHEKPNEQTYHEAGEIVMKKWLKEDWRKLGCTAILAHNDSAAIGVIKALSSTGLNVPKDLSVVGFDGQEISDLYTPRLTTIKVPLQEIGVRAIKVLLDQMREGAGAPEKVLLPVHLKPGESTAEV